jgi:hypothetical protein
LACKRCGQPVQLKSVTIHPRYFNLTERWFVCARGAEEADFLEGLGDDAADGRVPPADGKTN